MRVAITSKGDTPEVELDPRFGRARKFIIMDTGKQGFEVMDNEQNLNAAQGAGIQAAQAIASKSVSAVITGHCGPNAFRALKAAKIDIFTGVSGSVKEVFEKFKKGELKLAENADVDGHW